MSSPLLLVHGLFGSLSDPTILHAFDGVDVLAPALLGYAEYVENDVSKLRLEDQADHLVGVLDDANIETVDVLGHSVGGAVAVLLATRHPDRVRALVSLEGNLTPPDAFWSAELSRQSLVEIETLLADYRADVAGWIGNAGVKATPETLRIATGWLACQGARTLRAQAAAVVAATDREDYLTDLRHALEDGLELHLIAGARSRADWHVPADIEHAATSSTVLPGRGHLMMLEAPKELAEVVADALGSGQRKSGTSTAHGS